MLKTKICKLRLRVKKKVIPPFLGIKIFKV